MHACWSKGLVSDFLCLKRREGEKRRGLLNRRGRRRRWNWLGLGLLDFDSDLVQWWWAWTRWGLSRAAVGGAPGSSPTGNNERWTKEFNTDEDFSQSVTVSQLLKGLGCGHPLCPSLSCSAHHACGRRCQGEFNLIIFFLLMPKCLILLYEVDSLGEHTQRRVWKSNLSKCCHCCRPSRWMKQILGALQNLTFHGCWWAKDFFQLYTLYNTTPKKLSTGGWWCWCHFSPCSENHCGGLFKGNQSGEFLEFFDLQVKIMRLFKNKQRCCSNEAGCCCEFGCTVCLS